MYRRQAAYLFVMLIMLVSIVLTSCGQATPTAVPQPTVGPTSIASDTQAPSEDTQPPPAATAPEPTQAEAAEPTAVPETGEKKVTTFIWTQEFNSLNPLYTNMWFSTVTQQLWLAWAWEFNDQNEAFPKLVTEIPSQEKGSISADGTTITMTLRSDIKWSDNTPMTSKDFIFTYEMATNPKNTVASSYPYDKVETMTAPDDQTVVIKFAEPFAPWQATMWHGILPEHVLRPVFDQEGTIDNAPWNLAPTIGCGPYVFQEWESGSFARFVANENYWGTKPKIDEIFIRFVPDDASQVAALQAGDGQLGTFIAYSDVPKLKDAGIDIVTERSGYNEGWFFLINEERGHPALLDVNVRKAIAMAFDRESLNKDLLLGLTNVPASFWDALPFFNDPPLQNYSFDPEKAKELLDQAGWKDSNGDSVRDKDGKELVLRYGTNIREIRQDTQAVAQQQLGEVGIKLELSSFESDTFFADYANNGPAATGQLDIMQWSDGPVFPDADIYYWLCSEIPSDDYPTGANWFFLCDQELDELIKLQATQVNQQERQQTIAKINQIFYDKVYWLGMWQDPDVWAVSPQLLNVKMSGVTPFYSITEWDMK